MRHHKWITAQEIDRWAESNDAKTRLPELIRRLVHATIEPADLEHINFPGGEETHRPGYDGETKAKRGNAKVPEGIAYWEVSARGDVKAKLDDDYETRINARGAGDFQKVTYIGVTAHDYQGKKEWTEEKRKLAHWGDVRAYDSDDLEQWLETAPGVALWLSGFVSKRPDGLWDLSTNWLNLERRLKRKLPPSVLLGGREKTTNAFKDWLKGSPRTLCVHGQSPQEVVDVFTAWVESLPISEQDAIASRAVIVEQPEVWRALSDSEYRLILIRSERLELNEEEIAGAERKGHHVLRPLSSIRSGGDGVLRLERLDRLELEKNLKAAGLSDPEAFSLAQQSGGSFSVLKRRFSSQPVDKSPKWGEPEPAGILAPLLLMGAWQDNCVGDQDVIARLIGNEYSEIRKIVNRWRNEPDAPVRYANGVWEFVSPIDAWTFLHSSLNPIQLDSWEKLAGEVLGTNDPRLELTPEQRWQASVHGKKHPYSYELRKGLVRTLALLGTREDSELMADTVSLQNRVNRVAWSVLPTDSAWQRWASLGDLLPLLAEGAPNVVLEAAEAGVQGEKPELAKLFEQERSGVMGRAEHTGLLWALERLAWSPQLLSRVSLVLARLAEVDPDGQWANRPKASLRDIFFSWMPHTAASFEQRLAILNLLLSRHPVVAWKLLLNLLPHSHESIMNHSTPEWQFWAEGWQREITRAEYSRNVRALIDLAIEAAGEQPSRWADLLPQLSHFPREQFDRSLGILTKMAHGNIPRDSRLNIWNALRDEFQRHRYFHDADWSLPPETLDRLDALRDAFQPTNPVELAAPLFKPGFNDFGNSTMSWEEQEKFRQERRVQAVQAVVKDVGFDGIVQLARTANDAWSLGLSVAEATGSDYESQIIPAFLCSPEKSLATFAGGYSVKRIYPAAGAAWDWVEALPLEKWNAEQAGTVTAFLPFDQKTWHFVAQLGESVEKEYWKRTGTFGKGLSVDDIEHATRKFISLGRVSSAVDLLAMEIHQKTHIPAGLLLELLETAISTTPSEQSRQMDAYHIQALLKHLQGTSDVDEDKLGRLEWQLLPLLDRHSLLPATLHKWLARKPEFFMEVIVLLYRPHTETEEDKSEMEKLDESTKLKAERAWHLLNDWRLVPGTDENAVIDLNRLRAWVQSVREKAKAADRLTVCDLTVGTVLAHGPLEPDGSWPCIAIREVLDEVNSPELKRGFVMGIHNKRGVTSRGMREGGGQERQLAAQYESYAKRVQNRWPRTASALMEVATDYLEQAKREDAQASVES